MRFFFAMKVQSPLLALLVCVAAACGDNAVDPAVPDAQAPDALVPDAEPCEPARPGTPASDDILDRLRVVPGATVEESSDPPAGYRSFLIVLEQPVDHAAPCGATFAQHLTL